MNATVRGLVAMWVVLLGMGRFSGAEEDSHRITLDEATRSKCLAVLRQGLKGSEFWPAMHAAEGLTIGGQGREVIAYLTPKLDTETDDQHRCGLAREIARAGDRRFVPVMLGILEGSNTYGHVHAAESLFKVYEIGDGEALRRGADQSANTKLKLMSAAALFRGGDSAARQTLRDLVNHEDPKEAAIVAWALGQIGDASDIPRLKAQIPRCPDATTRSYFEYALAMLGDPDGVRALLANLSSPEDGIRTYAANFAGEARLVSSAPQLKSLLDDNVADIRIRAAQSLLMLAGPEVLPYRAHAEVLYQELNAGYCWFHPRAAAMPGHGKGGEPAVIVTIQKHLHADDHYSGLYYLRTDDLGKTWTGPTVIPELDWTKGEKDETIAVCDVTPGWLSHSQKLLAIGIKLRYSPAGHQLLDKPRSHECAYATFDPQKNVWSSWTMLDVPHRDGKFYQVAPGCVQWLEKDDGTLLIPCYVSQREGGHYTTTVLHCAFDGQTLKYLANGNEMTIPSGRGLYEPSLTRNGGTYFLTLRSDDAAWVATSDDGLNFTAPRKWTFDDGADLGSYNTQAHWLSHSHGLFLCYTRRGAHNDHIARNRAPIFVAQVDPVTLQVLRRTESPLLPERGVMLGNFGAAAITPGESWVTDSEYIVNDKPHPQGADGTTWLGRIKWSKPNQSVK